MTPGRAAALCAALLLALCAAASPSAAAGAAAAPMTVDDAAAAAGELRTASRRRRFLAWGRWCRVQRKRYPASYACRDGLDCLCKRHEMCYRRHGHRNCLCDMQLVNVRKPITSYRSQIVIINMDLHYEQSHCFIYVNVRRRARCCRRSRYRRCLELCPVSYVCRRRRVLQGHKKYARRYNYCKWK